MCNSTIEVYFYPNACHVCRVYGKSVKLKRCSGCKMIAYCGREHQRKHWPRHKDLCRIFTEIVQRAGTVFGARDKRESSEESWIRAKTNLMLLVQMKLGRKLLPYETEMLQFPRSCETCHETDSQRLVDCSNCPFASFCHDHLSNNKEHSGKCEISRFCFEINTAGYAIPEPNLRKYSTEYENIPKSMREIIDNYPLPYDRNETIPSAKFWAAFVSEYLTRPYTFLYATSRLNDRKLSRTNIHVIGSNANEIKSLDYWEILLHHWESLEELRIILVGPELVRDSYRMELCDLCNAKNSKIYVEMVSEFYADYATSEFFVKPDYTVGFNLGIHESESPENDTWASSIEELAKQDCPFFMTSYTLQESKEERERINLLLDNCVEFRYAGKNPFSSLRPYRDFESEGFFYQNQYLTIYEKLS